MAQSLAKVYIHLIFSTKDRHPLIKPSLMQETFSYIAGILRGMNCTPLIVGGTNNHIHSLFVLDKVCSVSNIVQHVKGGSSKWYQEKTHNYFAWQSGYAALSVSQSQVEAVKNYINRQQEHHMRHSFEDELREFLQKYEIDYDENYLWQ